jgi:hypothetical protein
MGPRLPAIALPAALAAALGLTPARAGAFCRSTTCRGEACQKDDQGCVLSGRPLFWAGTCVGFSMQRDGTAQLPLEQVRETVRRAFATWSDVDCGGGATASIAFSQLADTMCRRPEFNRSGANANIVLFRDDDWDYKTADNTLAQTTVTFSTDTGEILDVDISVNAAFNELTVSDTKVMFDLQSILTHEIGHLVGIGHSPDLRATMNASYDPGSLELRKLHDDDVAAVCAIYPPGRAGRCDPTPRGGFTPLCAGSQLAEAEPAGGCALGPRLGGQKPEPTASWPRFAGLAALAAATVAARRRRGAVRAAPGGSR